MTPIPYFDLHAQHAPIREELLRAMAEVLDCGEFVAGAAIQRFEEEFAAYCGARYAVGVGSGSDALLLSLLACEIGPGDEVITVPNTFVATVEAIRLAGATPVLVDVDPHTGTLDPDKLEAAITAATRAVIPVHLFGHPADMDPILRLAEARGLVVIEDACQAHGSRYRGRSAGTLGRLGCFSFYPGKNLGALGDAGAVVTDDLPLYHRLRALREHGQTRKNAHLYLGWTARMDGIQAAALSVKLKRLEAGNLLRRHWAAEYRSGLAGLPELTLPAEAPYAYHNYHIFAIRTSRRDELQRVLAEQGIVCGIHYPVPIHRQPAFRHLDRDGELSVSEQLAGEILSLPMHPALTAAQVQTVCNAIAVWQEHSRTAYAVVA